MTRSTLRRTAAALALTGFSLTAALLWRSYSARQDAPPASSVPRRDAWADPAVASWSVGPIQVHRYESRCDAGPLRGLIAKIDLADPSIEFLVTPPLPDGAKPGDPGAGGDTDPRYEARLKPADEWMDQSGCTLVTNANYFGRLPSDDTLLAKARGWTRDEHVDVIGISISNSSVVSPARIWKGRPDPALLIGPDLVAHIGYFSDDDVAGKTPILHGQPALAGAAGIGPSKSEPDLGTLLVEAGKNLGPSARTEPTHRHPRTAVGVTSDGRTLILVTIDGRQPQHSVGMTLPELADVLIAEGADTAINLDGGGSTTMLLQLPDGHRLSNKPSDGRFRSTANHLGIRLRPKK